MQITTKFDMFQKVMIKDLDYPGKIIKIIIDGNNLRYLVEYWGESKLMYAELSEDSLDFYKKEI